MEDVYRKKATVRGTSHFFCGKKMVFLINQDKRNK